MSYPPPISVHRVQDVRAENLKLLLTTIAQHKRLNTPSIHTRSLARLTFQFEILSETRRDKVNVSVSAYIL